MPEFKLSNDRRTRRNGTRFFDPKQFYERQHEIVNLKLLGMKNTAIAETLGVTTMTVANAANSTLGKQKLAIMRGARDADTLDVAKEIVKLVPKALAIYDEILDGESGASLALRKHTADTVLIDLAGHGAPKRIEGRFAHAHMLDNAAIEAIKQRGRQAASELGLLVNEAAQRG